MKKTMLTSRTLDRFEAEYITDTYTEKELERVEFAAYVANMNRRADWTEDDVFADFLRVLGIDHITVTPKTTEEEPKEDEAMITLEALKNALKAHTDRSAWGKGVTLYAWELFNHLEEMTAGGYFDMKDFEKPRALRGCLLNGAKDWKEYSWGGCSLCYNGQIAERLCTPSELKRTRNGARKPNSREEWLDTQARALFQAANLLYRLGTSVRA